jgi:hypothetical protein
MDNGKIGKINRKGDFRLLPPSWAGVPRASSAAPPPLGRLSAAAQPAPLAPSPLGSRLAAQPRPAPSLPLAAQPPPARTPRPARAIKPPPPPPCLVGCNAPNFAVEFFSFLYSPKFGRYLSFSFSLAKP